MTSRHPAAHPCGHDRRTFLKGVGLTAAAGTAATGLAPRPAEAAGAAPFFTEPPPEAGPLPKVSLAATRSPA